MLGKLLKHEFRATGRVMLPVLGVLLVLACFANLSFSAMDKVDNSVLELLMGLLIAAFFIGVVAALVVVVVLMINRFYTNLLKDEGYLMFTLPASVHSIVWSKLIVSLVWFVVTGLVVMLAMFITVFTFSAMDFGEIFNNVPSFKELMAQFYAATGLSGGDVAGFIAEFIGLVLVSLLCTCLHIYAAMSLGHIFSNHKVILSVLFFVGISFLFQILTAVLGFSLGNSLDAMLPFETSGEMWQLAHNGLLAVMLYELALSAILYFTTTFSLRKGLNLA